MWLIIVLSQYSFSTLLIWREVMVLEGAYVTNQRNNLENVADELDSLLLFNIDRMVFFRNGMQSALETPLDFEILRNAEQEYMSKRHEPIWSVALHNRRTLPVYGVSDDFVDSQSSLSRNDALTGNELMAVLELGYLLRLVENNRGFNERMLYISRSGFFTSTTLPKTRYRPRRYIPMRSPPRGLPGNRSAIIPVAACSGRPFSMSMRKTTIR
jgi:hypothetical protein